MTTTCGYIRGILPRAAEGDLSPGESLGLARHLPRCTGCRILLARERRLLALLDGLEDPIPVEPSLTDRVMAELPDGPPPSRKALLRKRGLKLAGFVGFAALTAGLLSKLEPARSGEAPLPGLPQLDYEGMEALLGTFAGMARFVLAALSRVGTDFVLDLGLGPGLTGLVAGLLVPAVCALFLLTTALGLVGGYWRGGASPRAPMRFSSTFVERPSRLAQADSSPRSATSIRRM